MVLVTIAGTHAALAFARALVPEAALFVHEYPRCRTLFAASWGYRASLAEVGARVPLDGAYILLDQSTDSAVALVQGDLAPRRGVLMSDEQLREAELSGQPLPSTTVVYVAHNEPLRVIHTPGGGR